MTRAAPRDRNDLYAHAALSRVLAPRSIAVLGASPRAGAFGDRVLANLARYGGAVHLVNASYADDSRPAMSRLRRRDSGRDGLRGDHVGARGRRAGRAGGDRGRRRRCHRVRLAATPRPASPARAAAAGPAGRTRARVRRADDRAELHRRERLRASRPHHLHAAGRHSAAQAGAIGIVSQSGALAFGLEQASDRGMSVSHVLTSGNSCDVDMADLRRLSRRRSGLCRHRAAVRGHGGPVAAGRGGRHRLGRRTSRWSPASWRWASRVPRRRCRTPGRWRDRRRRIARRSSAAGVRAGGGLRRADGHGAVLHQGVRRPRRAGSRCLAVPAAPRSWPPTRPRRMACRCRSRSRRRRKSWPRAFPNSAPHETPSM